MNTDIEKLVQQKGQMYDWASKISYKRALTPDEENISKVVDAWAKDIGKKGYDSKFELANYITKTITPAVYDRPDALLSAMFNRGSIGEFDDFVIDEEPRNTLKAYDAAKGGNVPKSYIDTRVYKPTWTHKQIETEVSFADLRRGGYKTVANLATFAQESLMNAMIADVFNLLDDTITATNQTVTLTGSTLDKTSLDTLALYVLDEVDSGDTPFIFSLNKYAQAIANMANYTSFMSDQMKDDFNRYGLIKEYDGLAISGISGAKRTATGELLVPDKRIFGVAGKIGELDMRGSIRVYESPDYNQEKYNLKITGFEYGTCITRPQKVGKIAFSD